MPVPLLIALKDKLPDGGSLVKKDAAILTCHLETEVVAVLGSGDVMWLVHLFADQETEGIWVGSYKTHHLVSHFV